MIPEPVVEYLENDTYRYGCQIPCPLYGKNSHMGLFPRENDAFTYGQNRSIR